MSPAEKATYLKTTTDKGNKRYESLVASIEVLLTDSADLLIDMRAGWISDSRIDLSARIRLASVRTVLNQELGPNLYKVQALYPQPHVVGGYTYLVSYIDVVLLMRFIVHREIPSLSF